LYVTHKEEDHHTKYPPKSGNSLSKEKPAAAGSTNKSMALSDNLKAAMVSKFKCSASDAAKLWSEVASSAEKDF
jgi:hypothetical protein